MAVPWHWERVQLMERFRWCALKKITGHKDKSVCFCFWRNKQGIQPNEKENHWLYPSNVLKIRDTPYLCWIYLLFPEEFFRLLIGGVGLDVEPNLKKSFIQGWEKSKRPSNNLQVNESRKLQWVFLFILFIFNFKNGHTIKFHNI